MVLTCSLGRQGKGAARSAVVRGSPTRSDRRASLSCAPPGLRRDVPYHGSLASQFEFHVVHVDAYREALRSHKAGVNRVVNRWPVQLSSSTRTAAIVSMMSVLAIRAWSPVAGPSWSTKSKSPLDRTGEQRAIEIAKDRCVFVEGGPHVGASPRLTTIYSVLDGLSNRIIVAYPGW
jgi:hypothetical protein